MDSGLELIDYGKIVLLDALKGSPATLLYADLVPLAIFTFVLALLATHSFQKRLT